MTPHGDHARCDYDDAALSGRYVAGRAHAPETKRQWMDAVKRRTGRVGVLADVGAGTGRFSVPLADHVADRVVAVEPSARMREQTPPHERVRCVGGVAEALPLRRASCDVAFLSMVLHHLPDLDGAGRELGRVVRPGGCVLVRHIFMEGYPHTPLFRFFPRVREIDERRMPTLARLDDALASGGLVREAKDVVVQTLDPSMAAHLARMRTRAVSTFAYLTEAELQAGFAAMEEAARHETEPQPVTEPIELVAYRRRPT